jgi:glycopeptide antibiotics resistance protein
LNGEEGETLPIQLRSWPFGLIALALIAGALLVLLMGNSLYKPAGGGESLMAQAFEALFIAFALWIVLVAMLVLGGVMGGMPRWAAWLAIVLVPMAGIADVTAVDMCSRHMEWAVVVVALLPLLIAFYAFWARLRFKSAPPGERTSALVWGAVFLLSAVTFVIAAY